MMLCRVTVTVTVTGHGSSDCVGHYTRVKGPALLALLAEQVIVLCRSDCVLRETAVRVEIHQRMLVVGVILRSSVCTTAAGWHWHRLSGWVDEYIAIPMRGTILHQTVVVIIAHHRS